MRAGDGAADRASAIARRGACVGAAVLRWTAHLRGAAVPAAARASSASTESSAIPSTGIGRAAEWKSGRQRESPERRCAWCRRRESGRAAYPREFLSSAGKFQWGGGGGEWR